MGGPLKEQRKLTTNDDQRRMPATTDWGRVEVKSHRFKNDQRGVHGRPEPNTIRVGPTHALAPPGLPQVV